MAQGETVNVLFKIKRKKSYPGKGKRKTEIPEVGGNLAQLRNREKIKRSVEEDRECENRAWRIGLFQDLAVPSTNTASWPQSIPKAPSVHALIHHGPFKTRMALIRSEECGMKSGHALPCFGHCTINSTYT